jgi:hypothetical protein
MGYRLNNPADRAEYDKLRKRFREEEEALNVKNLLYGDSRLERTAEKGFAGLGACRQSAGEFDP